jgi:HD-GYP domain-containing protein (c-di-GMP phosphodiesterase class II)
VLADARAGVTFPASPADEGNVSGGDWRSAAAGSGEKVRLLADAVDSRGAEALRRDARVALIATAIAARLGLAEETRQRLGVAAQLHDVGMSAIPETIISKQGPLTAAEMEEVRRHPVEGQRIVSEAGLTDVGEWIRHHHERWDGNGYPDGVCGPEIPIESRILAISDALAAMTADRPYRSAMGAEMAGLEIKSSAGTQFDPGIARIVIDLLDRDAFAAEAQAETREPTVSVSQPDPRPAQT